MKPIEKTNFSQKIVGVFLAILPPLCIYKVLPGFTLATIAVFLGIFFLICFRNKYSFKISKPEFSLYISVSVLGLLSCLFNMNTMWYSLDLFIHNYFDLTISFLALILLANYCDWKYFLWTSIVFSLFASILCMYQWGMIIITGSFIKNMYLPWFEISRDIETITVTRPCAFFTEPAHACLYIGPALYSTLLIKKYYLSAFLVLGMLFSSSTTGLLLLFVLPLVYSYNSGGGVKIFLGIVITFIVAYLLINTYYPQIIEFATNKVNNTEASDDQRLLGPLQYFKYLSISNLIFGIGLNQLENFILAARGSLLLEGSGNYANSFLYMIFSYGFIGFYFLCKYLMYYWKKNKKCIGYMIIILTVMASDQILFSPFFVYFVLTLMFANCVNQHYFKKIA